MTKERTLSEVLSELSELQIRFVSCRVSVNTDKQAAEMAGVHRVTVGRWRKSGAPIEEAIRLIRINAVQSAKEALEAATLLAAETLIDEMATRGDERVRAAFGVLDRGGLPATTNTNANITSDGLMVVLDEPPEN